MSEGNDYGEPYFDGGLIHATSPWADDVGYASSQQDIRICPVCAANYVVRPESKVCPSCAKRLDWQMRHFKQWLINRRKRDRVRGMIHEWWNEPAS